LDTAPMLLFDSNDLDIGFISIWFSNLIVDEEII